MVDRRRKMIDQNHKMKMFKKLWLKMTFVKNMQLAMKNSTINVQCCLI